MVDAEITDADRKIAKAIAELRKIATEILDQGHNGWPNGIEASADDLEQSIADIRANARAEGRQQGLTQANALREALQELVEVANLRGDNDLPAPPDDPKLWTARMQDAWLEAETVLMETK